MRFSLLLKFSSMTTPFLILGCATTLIETANDMQIVESDSALPSNCTALGPISIQLDNAMLWDRSERYKDARIKLRNAAASNYPDSNFVTISDSPESYWGPEEANGIAWECKFGE